MKSVIESYIYLIILVLIVYFSLDFIMINARVSKVNTVARYVENTIEVNKEEGKAKAISMASSNGMDLVFKNAESTTDFCYYEYDLSYKILSASFRINKTNTYHGLARYKRNNGG